MKESVIEETPFAIINNKKVRVMLHPAVYYEHRSGDYGRNKFGEVIETYRDGSHTACCL